jgi:DNA sulfur modification protein DndD
MLIAGDDGRWYPPTEQPDDIIERILPTSLHQYFFFDGETIDHIFRYGEKNHIAEDTKELLGVKVLDRAIDHLKKAKKSLQDELKMIGDTETKKLLQERHKLEENSQKIQEKQNQIQQEIETLEQLKQVLNQKLIELSSVAELQQLKRKLESQEQSIRTDLVNTKKALKQLISNRSYTVFLPEITFKFRHIIQDLRQEGQLPSGIKQEFVETLLNNQLCICGTPLTEGTEAHNHVNNWMEKAGTADVEEAAIRMETQVTELEKQFTKFWQELDQKQLSIQQQREQLAQVENELDNITQKVRNFPDQDIQGLQKQLDTVENQLKSLILEKGGNQQHLEIMKREIEGIDQKIIKNKAKEEKHLLAQKRMKITEDVIQRIIEVRSRLEKQFRLSLEQRVQEIFSS